MSVSRLNFSHVPRGDYAYSSDIIANVRGCEGMHCRVLQRGYNMTAVLLDTKGPEIRTGVVEGYVSGEKNLYVELEDGKEVLVTTDERMREKVTSSTLYLDYKQIGSTVTPGDVLLLDDGLIGLEVTAVSDGKTGDDGEEYCEVNCIVKNGGALGSVKVSSRVGWLLPSSPSPFPSLSSLPYISARLVSPPPLLTQTNLMSFTYLIYPHDWSLLLF